MDNPKPKVFKPVTPVSAVLKAVLIAVGCMAFVLLAIWQISSSITDAKMTGIVVAKEFKPLAEPEEQITLNKTGTVRRDKIDGDYIITVEVPQKNGTKKPYTVWLNDKARYETIKVGDNFDVGPYLVR